MPLDCTKKSPSSWFHNLSFQSYCSMLRNSCLPVSCRHWSESITQPAYWTDVCNNNPDPASASSLGFDSGTMLVQQESIETLTKIGLSWSTRSTAETKELLTIWTKGFGVISHPILRNFDLKCNYFWKIITFISFCMVLICTCLPR